MMGRLAEGFPWPALQGLTPRWAADGGFQVGDAHVSVLTYNSTASGWSESLTSLHEEVAGEGTHPIDMASRRRARASLKRYLRVPAADAVILEAGCSTGYLLEELVQDWPESLVIGSDYIEGPLIRLAARMPRIPVLQFDLLQCPLPSASVDGVVLLNVLEHIEDDRAALAQVFRVLKPGGVAVLEVPAGPHLYDAYDQHLQHFRRYRLRDLVRLASDAGFATVDRSHLGCFVYPPFALVKRRNQRLLDAPQEQREKLVQENIRSSAGAGGLLGTIIAAEAWLGRWVRYPVGIRCVLTAVKPR